MAQFITVNPISGSGSSNLQVQVQQNNGRNERTNIIKVQIEGSEDDYDTCEVIQEGRPEYIGAPNIVSSVEGGSHIGKLNLGRSGGKFYVKLSDTNTSKIRIQITSGADAISNTISYKTSSNSTWRTLTSQSAASSVEKSWDITLTSEGSSEAYSMIIEFSCSENTSTLAKTIKFKISGNNSKAMFDLGGTSGEEYVIQQSPKMSLNPTKMTIGYAGEIRNIAVNNVAIGEAWSVTIS